MKLSNLIEKAELSEVFTIKDDVEIMGLAYDSRRVVAGDLYINWGSKKSDTEAYAKEAIEKGAVVIVSEVSLTAKTEVPLYQFTNTKEVLAKLSKAFYGYPTNELKVVGITGTNGKTTTAILTQHIIEYSQKKSGFIGTLYYDTGLEQKEATHTTPESLDLQKLFSEMVENGCDSVVMEVSSHALAQNRVEGVNFKTVGFTNLSQDHLDFHGDMDSYYSAKRELFLEASNQGVKMVINGDDHYGRMLIEEFGDDSNHIAYGSSERNHFRVSRIRINFDGTEFVLETRGREFLVKSPLIGRYNVMNSIAALGLATSVGCNFRESVKSLAIAPQVPGRLENVSLSAPFRVFVDYAHTPDALKSVLGAIKELDPKRIITVFGCGGDRDRTKRALMATAAEEGSDFCVLTTDNPRTEDPKQIFSDTKKGFRHERHMVISDRREAIKQAIMESRPRDVVLVAGKGHETYQEIDGIKHDFDDREICRGYIRQVIDEKAQERADKEIEHRAKDIERKIREKREAENE